MRSDERLTTLSTSLAEPSLPARCVAVAAESVLEIDPTMREVSTFGMISSSVGRKWVEGVLARNGKIYAIVRFPRYRTQSHSNTISNEYNLEHNLTR